MAAWPDMESQSCCELESCLLQGLLGYQALTGIVENLVEKKV